MMTEALNCVIEYGFRIRTGENWGSLHGKKWKLKNISKNELVYTTSKEKDNDANYIYELLK
jgi:hypothetical protein